MKFALINGQRHEAKPNLSGMCLACGQAMVSKCGEVKVWHWAHKGRRTCDPWWENETEWHRTWKGQFPESWQEIVHYADDGEKHIADVRTDQKWFIEFQHSYINPEERRSRDVFYKRLVWVVDGTRRKRDVVQFRNALNRGKTIGWKILVEKTFSNNCSLLREWADSPALVFCDFGDDHVLWWLLKEAKDGWLGIAPFSRSDFVEIHRNGVTQKARDFEEFVKEHWQFESLPKAQEPQQVQPRPTQDLRQHLMGRFITPRRRF
jgi:hypothetical protein